MKQKQKPNISWKDKLVVSTIALGAVGLFAGGVMTLGLLNCGVSVCAKEVKASTELFVDARPENIDKTKNNIIFFHARWCGNCLATVKDFEKNSSKKPSSVVIYDVDPDDSTNSDLTKKYNITAYPTFIKIDTNGNEIGKLIGRTTLEEFLTELN
jgi:thiol-disulfide isomerase/thioredoxin